MILACPYCKAKADPAAVKCASCGKTMSRACPACAETIASNAATCKYCGEAVPAMKEASLPAKAPTPDIVYMDCKTRKSSCCGAGRPVFWVLILALAGFCAYSVVRTKIHLRHVHDQQQQKIDAPALSY